MGTMRTPDQERSVAGRFPAAPDGVRPSLPCRWDLTPAEARQEQERLRGRIRICRLPWRRLEVVAGCDVAVSGDRLHAAVLVYHLPTMEPVDSAAAEDACRFPYIPGLLSFREVPVLLQAFAGLRVRPEAVLCDGQGRAHPRRFGLASHLGVLLDLPTVGCAKSRLIGSYREPGKRRGSWADLQDADERIGAVLRTRDEVRPLFISVGHRAAIADAVRLVLACGRGFRLPEPTRRADQEVGRLARQATARAGILRPPTRRGGRR